VLLFDEGGEGVDILLKHLLQGFLGEVALVVERVPYHGQIGLGLPHDRTGNARQDVLQTLGRVDAAERPRRIGDDAGRLAEERTLAIGTRRDIDGVFERLYSGVTKITPADF
jgi:hypothetical protein